MHVFNFCEKKIIFAKRRFFIGAIFNKKQKTMTKTLLIFKEGISKSRRVRERLIQNVDTQTDREITLNLSDLNFDFGKKEVKISHYIKSEDYPDVVLKFNDFISLVQS